MLTGLVAGVFDPLGLATPITGGFKLDLHQLCELKLDWDDKVPEELKAAVAGATTAAMVRRNLEDRYGGATFCTDSTICLYWITQGDRPLQTGVRNAVTEIRRFS